MEEISPTPPLPRPPARRRVLLIQSWWEERVLRGVGKYAAEHGWVLDSSMRWHGRLPASPWRGDGIIASSGMARPGLDIARFLRKAKCPVVETQGTTRLPGAGQVAVSHEQIGRLGANHLLSLHFQQLGFVTFEENATETPRRLAFRQAAEAGGAKFHALTAANLVREAASLPRPAGLMAVNDANAIQVIVALIDAGWAIPEDFAVLGVDDTEMACALAPVSLSSVNCNYEAQGYEAASLLDRLMDGHPAPEDPLIIPPRGVTVRHSTDAVTMDDPDSARFLRHLREHYLEAQKLDQISKSLGVSMRKVQMNFKKQLGRSVLDELTRLRIEHAKKLLPDRERLIEDIGRASGFSTRFHFIRAFQRVIGQTPNTYRKKLRHR